MDREFASVVERKTKGSGTRTPRSPDRAVAASLGYGLIAGPHALGPRARLSPVPRSRLLRDAQRTLGNRTVGLLLDADGPGRNACIQRTPERQDCSEEVDPQIVQAHGRAIAMLVAINQSLADFFPLRYSSESMAPETRPGTRSDVSVELRVAFDIRDAVRDRDKIRQVRRVLALAVAGLRAEDFNYQCDYPHEPWYSACAPGVHAWTGGIYDIHLCQDFMRLTPATKARKIAHEALHKWGATEHGQPEHSAFCPEAYDYLLERLSRSGS